VSEVEGPVVRDDQDAPPGIAAGKVLIYGTKRVQHLYPSQAVHHWQFLVGPVLG
jgi:hypothetical protein